MRRVHRRDFLARKLHFPERLARLEFDPVRQKHVLLYPEGAVLLKMVVDGALLIVRVPLPLPW